MTFLRPSDVVRELPQYRYSTALDLGAGAGHISKLLSYRADHVISLDVHPSSLNALAALKKDHQNLSVVKGDLEQSGGIPLKNNSADLVLLTNVLFQIKNKEACMEEVKRVLSPHGCAMIVDWENSFNGIGPYPHDVLSSYQAYNLIQRSGMRIERELGVMNDVPSLGPYHYGFLLSK